MKGDEKYLENNIIEDNNIIIYKTDDGQVEIEVQLEDENVWLTQNSMAKLFDTTRNNITMHIKNIFNERELQEKSVSKDSLLTAKDGKNYKTKVYNLDLIISVGYRVKSIRGTQFRVWANKLIKEYLIKGYNLNVRRFKNNGGETFGKSSPLAIICVPSKISAFPSPNVLNSFSCAPFFLVVSTSILKIRACGNRPFSSFSIFCVPVP